MIDKQAIEPESHQYIYYTACCSCEDIIREWQNSFNRDIRGMEMAEPFNTTIRLKNEDARRFREYDNNPWNHENDRSRAAAKRAQELAKALKF